MGEGEGRPRPVAPRRYTVELRPAAERVLRKLPRPDQERIRERIDGLAGDPRPQGVKALQGNDAGLLRIRAGDYRIVYFVRDATLLVVVVRIGHRREVYRG